MQSFTIANRVYTIEFRHARRDGHHPSLAQRGPIRAITTCIVVAQAASQDHSTQLPLFIACESVVCVEEDRFSRAFGRANALWKVVTRCAPLRKANAGAELFNLFLRSEMDKNPLPTPHTPLSEDRRAELIEGGRVKRLARKLKRWVPNV